MSSSLTVLVIVAALLGFWAVGAYNRLVRLRSAIHAAFAALDAQIRQRHELLQQWMAASREVLDAPTQLVDAVESAAGQLVQAADNARLRPSGEPAIEALRLAEQALLASREQLVSTLPSPLHQPTMSDAGADLSGLGDQVAAVDSTLAFARTQFNLAVEEYNRAFIQFPTRLLTGMFGFQAAACL